MLQPESPLDDLVRRLTNLFYLVMLLGAAILPAIRQARERKRREREEGETSAPIPDTALEPPEPEPEPSLERKLRRYFEERERRETPPSPAKPAPRAMPSEKRRTGLGGILTAETDRAEIGREQRALARRLLRDSTPQERRRRKGRRARSLRRLLRDRKGARTALVAAEILAPPVALRDPLRTGGPPADG